jgi:hypothetical protein
MPAASFQMASEFEILETCAKRLTTNTTRTREHLLVMPATKNRPQVTGKREAQTTTITTITTTITTITTTTIITTTIVYVDEKGQTTITIIIITTTITTIITTIITTTTVTVTCTTFGILLAIPPDDFVVQL